MNRTLYALVASIAALAASGASGSDLRGLQPASEPPGLILPASPWSAPTNAAEFYSTAAVGLRLHRSAEKAAAAIGERRAAGHGANRGGAPDTGESYMLYGGVREVPRLGQPTVESYGGVFYPLAENWGSSLEAGVTRDSPFASRRYSLFGQFHTTLSPGHELSLGLKYTYDTPQAPLYWLNSESAGGVANGDALAPRPGGGAGYQLQLSYLYGVRNTVGLAYASGRELEYFGLPYDAFADARQFMLTGHHWLSPNWAFNYDIYAPDSNLLRRQGLRLGLRYRF